VSLPTALYDLDVDELDDFYVSGLQGTAVLVHNEDVCSLSGIPEDSYDGPDAFGWANFTALVDPSNPAKPMCSKLLA
jgi:hypothetical protein